MNSDYESALKKGRKEYKAKVAAGEFPYLPVLDEILKNADIQTEQNMGLIQVPLDLVVGTVTIGRTQSFASNFMPIMDVNTEFCSKWSNLSESQKTEGIRDPIKAYEYMNRYYVLEGNKRVSVLKYFGAAEIPAMVTRKVPRYSDDPEIRRYYELMHFIDVSGIYSLEFTKLGFADKLLAMVSDEKHWSKETCENFNQVLYRFTNAYNFHGGARLPITVGDALTAFLNVYDFQSAVDMSEADYKQSIPKVWNEFVVMTEHHAVDLVLDPVNTGDEKRSLFSFLVPASKKLDVTFLYPRDPKTSDWIYAHELGRKYLEQTFAEEIHTSYISDVTDANVEAVIEKAIDEGTDIIFGVAPQMMNASLKAAVDHPKVKILNCSLNTPHQYIRTYYARMYEAKFISGMIAGALAENDRIAYIADYPLYGMIANINAFALGAACTNPRAKIYLDWSTRKDFDRKNFLETNDIHYVSDQDMITPSAANRQFGLYHVEDGRTENLVVPLWNWGAFYEKLLRSILAGSYQQEDETHALNYWWGMSAGVIDIILSKQIPVGVARIAEHVRDDIANGYFAPFTGKIIAQDGTVKNAENQEMKPRDIMKMDYLVENVIGEIPSMDKYVDDAKSVIEEKGVEETKSE